MKAIALEGEGLFVCLLVQKGSEMDSEDALQQQQQLEELEALRAIYSVRPVPHDLFFDRVVRFCLSVFYSLGIHWLHSFSSGLLQCLCVFVFGVSGLCLGPKRKKLDFCGCLD